MMYLLQVWPSLERNTHYILGTLQVYRCAFLKLSVAPGSYKTQGIKFKNILGFLAEFQEHSHA